MNKGFSNIDLQLLCYQALESKDHLFFNGNYSWSLWDSIRNQLQIQGDTTYKLDEPTDLITLINGGKHGFRDLVDTVLPL